MAGRAPASSRSTARRPREHGDGSWYGRGCERRPRLVFPRTGAGRSSRVREKDRAAVERLRRQQLHVDGILVGKEGAPAPENYWAYDQLVFVDELVIHE